MPTLLSLTSVPIRRRDGWPARRNRAPRYRWRGLGLDREVPSYPTRRGDERTPFGTLLSAPRAGQNCDMQPSGFPPAASAEASPPAGKPPAGLVDVEHLAANQT